MDTTLYVLDGYSVIYRSYFAFIRNPLRNPRGENSSAVFGFVRTLLSIFQQYHPSHFAVIMDSTTPTFRHEKYSEYKANRDATPDDLHAQIPVIEEILQALGVPMVRSEGYEADDVMATYARRCREQGRPCRVITGDKDLLQLVEEPVRVLRPGKNGIEELDRDAVYRDWSVWPEQILDYLALIGDASDNVPGVKGIGAKTAAKLLEQFGTLEAIYDRLEEVSSKSQREKLESGRESAFLSKDLITLAYDAPVKLGPDELILGDLDYQAAAPLLLDQGMTAQLKEMGLDPADFSPSSAIGGNTAGSPESSSGDGGTSSAGAEGTDETSSVDSATGVPRRNGTSVPTDRGSHLLNPSAPPRERAAMVLDTLKETERAAISQPGEYELVDTLDALDRWIDAVRSSGVCAFDCETTGLDAMDAVPVGFSLGTEVGNGCYIPLVGPDGPVLPEDSVRERLRSILTDGAIRIVGQNLKYDWKILARWGIEITNIAFDTMIAAWLVDTTANSYSMDRLAEEYLGYQTIHFADLFKADETSSGGADSGRSGRTAAKDLAFSSVPLDRATRYAAEDADITFRLYRILDPLLDMRGVRQIFETLEMPLVPLLARIEMEGIGLDVFALEAYSQQLTDQIDTLTAEIHEIVGHEFNIGSTQQLQKVLFEERKLQPVKKTKTGYSTDNGVLQELAREDPVPERVLRYRLLTKLRSTYVDALPRMVNSRTGRIHTSLNQTGTATGRLSSTDPNLQNIPIKDEEGRRIRSAFIPREGCRFVSADYSQIELVILAHLSGDEGLSSAFRDGEDVHRRTAGLIFGVSSDEVTSEQRRIAKTINFGVMYGMSAFRLSNELAIPRKDADAFITAYFGTYSGIRRFIDETVAAAEKTGEVRTLAGRARPLPDINSRNRTVKAGVERVAVNTPIQGSGADIVKKAMLAVDRRLRAEGLAARIILQVHDELILECPEDEVDRVRGLVMEEMSTVVALSVPLRVSVEIGERWGDMHQ
jgi:DNA polymerase-1